MMLCPRCREPLLITQNEFKEFNGFDYDIFTIYTCTTHRNLQIWEKIS